MFFITKTTIADLVFSTPSQFCCNCGAESQIEVIETPLRRLRYFFVLATELTLYQTLPYCKVCRGSAKRVRLGWPSKLLTACLVTTAIFLGLTIKVESLPSFIVEHMFAISFVIGGLLNFSYFFWREQRLEGGRTYYQPVSLASLDRFDNVALNFYNKKYARAFVDANKDSISSGILKIKVID